MNSTTAQTSVSTAGMPATNSMKISETAEASLEPSGPLRLIGEIPSTVVVEEIASHVSLEVRGLSGEPVLRSDFALSDRVSVVKEKLQAVRKIPLWQQMLTCQGKMVEDKSKLQELSVQSEEMMVFEIVVRAGLSDEDMEAISIAGELLKEGTNILTTVMKRDISEVAAMKRPPDVILCVCLGALHLLAAHMESIPVKRNGSPKNLDWEGCRAMLRRPEFMEHLLQLPDHIDNGKLSKEQTTACDQQLQNVNGNDDSEKVQWVARCSRMCHMLIQYLMCIKKYHDSMAEISERFGGAAIKELMSKC
jgi:hypothetical protein